jgi:hypothetical protein
MILLETLSVSNQCHSTYFQGQQSAIRQSLYGQLLDFVLEKLPPNTPFQLEFSERFNMFPANNGSLVETTVTANLLVSPETKNSLLSSIDAQYEVLGDK